MNERSPRARRITRQPTPGRAHPIGTPLTGLSTNTGPLASSAWLVALGLLPDRERWFVEIELTGTGDAPATFVLEIYAEEWGFQLHHDGRSSWIRVTDVPFAHVRDEHGLRAHLPKLRDIRSFIRQLESRFGVQLDRAAPRIRTSIVGAEAALRAWINEP